MKEILSKLRCNLIFLNRFFINSYESLCSRKVKIGRNLQSFSWYPHSVSNSFALESILDGGKESGHEALFIRQNWNLNFPRPIHPKPP